MDGAGTSDRSPEAVFRCLEDSHRRLVGERLVPVDGPVEVRRRWLYEEAPFGVLAHDGGDDPLFVYANRTAQRWFGYAWDAFVGIPSRRSAGPEAQEDRDRLLADVARDGWADGYRGVRIAASGRPFWVEDVRMWNLLGDGGEYRGQAALLRRRRDVDP